MKFLRKVLNKEGFSGNSENVSEILISQKHLNTSKITLTPVIKNGYSSYKNEFKGTSCNPC